VFCMCSNGSVALRINSADGVHSGHLHCTGKLTVIIIIIIIIITSAQRKMLSLSVYLLFWLFGRLLRKLIKDNNLFIKIQAE